MVLGALIRVFISLSRISNPFLVLAVCAPSIQPCLSSLLTMDASPSDNISDIRLQWYLQRSPREVLSKAKTRIAELDMLLRMCRQVSGRTTLLPLGLVDVLQLHLKAPSLVARDLPIDSSKSQLAWKSLQVLSLIPESEGEEQCKQITNLKELVSCWAFYFWVHPSLSGSERRKIVQVVCSGCSGAAFRGLRTFENLQLLSSIWFFSLRDPVDSITPEGNSIFEQVSLDFHLLTVGWNNDTIPRFWEAADLRTNKARAKCLIHDRSMHLALVQTTGIADLLIDFCRPAIRGVNRDLSAEGTNFRNALQFIHFLCDEGLNRPLVIRIINAGFFGVFFEYAPYCKTITEAANSDATMVNYFHSLFTRNIYHYPVWCALRQTMDAFQGTAIHLAISQGTPWMKNIFQEFMGAYESLYKKCQDTTTAPRLQGKKACFNLKCRRGIPYHQLKVCCSCFAAVYCDVVCQRGDKRHHWCSSGQASQDYKFPREERSFRYQIRDRS
ncbi:hypothetical protein DL96DRAFT_345099 [Flagelloscypha sp. PMI_526]|nr:hypothetical protein DL96DRAFT_345099 [Flagelloscypha sp. PMI_526]